MLWKYVLCSLKKKYNNNNFHFWYRLPYQLNEQVSTYHLTVSCRKIPHYYSKGSALCVCAVSLVVFVGSPNELCQTDHSSSDNIEQLRLFRVAYLHNNNNNETPGLQNAFVHEWTQSFFLLIEIFPILDLDRGPAPQII